MFQSSEQKSSNRFICEKCNYITCRKSQYQRHLLTNKHNNETNMKQKSSKEFPCECGNIFNSRTTLWRHKNTCGKSVITTELVIELIKDNKELQNIIAQQNNTINTIVDKFTKQDITNISHSNNNNTTNSNNKSFNLNVFLNETCKEAINISDFVNSIKVSFEDLENTGRKGYIDGISNIITKNLKDLEEHYRPIHCSDYKREIIYIKDNDEWTKETDSKPILTKAIKVIANENIKQIKHWREKYPDCTDADSKKNNMYLKIVSNSMNGLTEEEGHRNIDKIISNVAKETIIQKNNKN